MERFSFQQLRVFEAIASTASFAQAAEQLGLTQPAVTMHLKQLEKQIGLALFEGGRGRKRVLSEAGTELLQHAMAILERVKQADEALASRRGATRGLLHLGVVPTANYFAPQLMMAFRERHPDVSLKLTVGRREEILELLESHRIDIAIGGYPPSEAEVDAVTFSRHPHCVVAAANDPIAKRRRLKWSDLRDEPFIFREQGSATRKFLEHLLTSQSLRVKVGIELSGNETVKQAVMAGMGLTFMSAHAVQVELQSGMMAILDLEGMPKLLDWCLMHRRNTQLSGVNALFHEFVRHEGARLIECVSSHAIVAIREAM